jgi:hypothetical protein
MLELLDRIIREGRVIRDAPISFTIAAICVGVLVFFGVNFHYSEVITEKEATIERMKQDQTSDERENNRLKIELGQTPTPTRFQGDSNAKLKETASELAAKLEAIGGQKNAEEERLATQNQRDMAAFIGQSRPDLNPKAQGVLQAFIQKETEVDRRYGQIYVSEYQADATTLREEMLSRLSPDALKKYQLFHGVYALGDFDRIAADLRWLADNLPPDQKPSTKASWKPTFAEEIAIALIACVLVGIWLERFRRRIKRRWLQLRYLKRDVQPPIA